MAHFRSTSFGPRVARATALCGLTALAAMVAGCPIAFVAEQCASDADCNGGAVCLPSLQECGEALLRDGGRRPNDAGTDPEPAPDDDAGPFDAGPFDAGDDAGGIDAGPHDAGTIDAGVDAGPVDAGTVDAGPIDAGPVDAGPGDAGPGDAGPVDAGPVDGGVRCFDADGDFYGVGCTLGPDCDESNPSVHTALIGFLDADLDGYTVGGERTLCTDGALPDNVLPTQSAEDDCDDSDDTLFTNQTLYVDNDNDTVTVGGAVLICVGTNPPLGYAIAQSPLVDCDDSDPNVGTSADTDSDTVPDCIDEDDDNDGLLDGVELAGIPIGFPTDPLNADTDGDGVNDDVDAVPTMKECSTEVLYSETFTSDAAGWLPNGNNRWARDTSARYLRSYTTAEGATAWIGENPSWDDYVVQAKVILRSAAGDAGLLFRAGNISPNNDGGQQYYAGIQLGSNRVVLARMDNGYTELASGGFSGTIDTAYTMKVQVAGTSLQVYMDDVLIVSDTDTSYSAGSIGLRTFRNPTDFDDIIVCR